MALVHRSPESGSENRLAVWGRWHAVFTYDLAGVDLLEMLAFLENVGLDAPFYILHPLRRAPRAVWAHASGAVNGASESGKTCASDGWPNSTTILLAGDIVEIYKASPAFQQTVRMTSDIVSNGSGQATLAFGQTLRGSPPDDSEVRVVNPRFTMVLNAPVEDQIDDSAFSSFTLEMREDV
jgi:hypothetical protein